MFNGTASKFLVSVMGAISVGLTSYYSSAQWEPAALAAVGAILVYLVPNASKAPAPTTPPVQAPLQAAYAPAPANTRVYS